MGQEKEPFQSEKILVIGRIEKNKTLFNFLSHAAKAGLETSPAWGDQLIYQRGLEGNLYPLLGKPQSPPKFVRETFNHLEQPDVPEDKSQAVLVALHGPIDTLTALQMATIMSAQKQMILSYDLSPG